MFYLIRLRHYKGSTAEYSKENVDTLPIGIKIGVNIEDDAHTTWAFPQDKEAERDAKYNELQAQQANIDKADKGQLVENAIELNDAIKGYLDEKLKTIQQKINDKTTILLSPSLTDTTLRQKHWNELLTIKAPYQTTLGLYKIAVNFERSLGISVSQDKDHPVHFFDENVFVQILTEIKNLPPQNPLEIPQRPSLWSDITKMIGVEEVYEVKQVKDEWIKLLNLIHSGISYTAKPTQPIPDLTGNGINQGI